MTGVTLYALADQLAAILDQVNEDGELPEEYGDVRELVAHKGASVAAYVAQKEMEAEAMRTRLKEVERHVRAVENRAKRLREYLAFNMAKVGITEIQTHDCLLSVKLLRERDESVEIFDESMVPVVYMNVPEPPAPKPDKAAIKRAIKAGQDVPGARIVKRDRLEIK